MGYPFIPLISRSFGCKLTGSCSPQNRVPELGADVSVAGGCLVLLRLRSVVLKVAVSCLAAVLTDRYTKHFADPAFGFMEIVRPKRFAFRVSSALFRHSHSHSMGGSSLFL